MNNGSFTLPPSGRILMPFDKAAFIHSLPVYCGSDEQAINIRYLTRFLDEDYYLMIRTSPSTQQPGQQAGTAGSAYQLAGSNAVLTGQSIDDQISVPVGSFLTMVAGHTDQTDAGFRVKWYDAGAQESMMDNYVNNATISGENNPNLAANSGYRGGFIDGQYVMSKKRGLFILSSPLAIANPGQLNVNITNLSANMAIIDMAFFFACPAFHMDALKPAILSNQIERGGM